jgi:hypothetical protein
MRFTVPASTVFKVLLAVVASLTGLSFVLTFIDRGLFASPFPGFERALRLFDVNKEANLPAWFSSSVLLVCSLVLWATARAKSAVRDRFARHWWVLAAAFLYLSLDELISLHEATSSMIRVRLDVSEGGAFSQAWVLLAAPLVLLFALAYLRFLIQLPARVKYLTLAAGCTYVAGALGMEVPGAYVRGEYGADTFAYAVMTTVEETMEMLGAVIFLYAMAVYAERDPAQGPSPALTTWRGQRKPDRPAPPTSRV